MNTISKYVLFLLINSYSLTSQAQFGNIVDVNPDAVIDEDFEFFSLGDQGTIPEIFIEEFVFMLRHFTDSQQIRVSGLEINQQPQGIVLDAPDKAKWFVPGDTIDNRYTYSAGMSMTSDNCKEDDPGGWDQSLYPDVIYGFRYTCDQGGDTCYGWIRMDIVGDIDEFVVKDYAFVTQGPRIIVPVNVGIQEGENIKPQLTVTQNNSEMTAWVSGFQSRWKSYEYRVYDVNSQLVWKKESGSLLSWSCLSWPSGVYILIVTDTKDVGTKIQQKIIYLR